MTDIDIGVEVDINIDVDISFDIDIDTRIDIDISLDIDIDTRIDVDLFIGVFHSLFSTSHPSSAPGHHPKERKRGHEANRRRAKTNA